MYHKKIAKDKKKTKSIYIDESGIANTSKHSTFSFVIIEISDTEKINLEIETVEKKLRLKVAHWRDMSWKVREKFATELSRLDFSAHVVIHKNPINIREAFIKSMEYSIVNEDYGTMIIDGGKDDKLIKIIRNFLRSKNNSISKIRQKSDESAPVLRIADFIAGATRSYYDDPDNINAKNIIDKVKSKILFTTVKF